MSISASPADQRSLRTPGGPTVVMASPYVARFPALPGPRRVCSESSAQRYASTNRGAVAKSPNTAVSSMNAVGFSCCDWAIGISDSDQLVDHFDRLALFVDPLGIAGPARHRRRCQAGSVRRWTGSPGSPAAATWGSGRMSRRTGGRWLSRTPGFANRSIRVRLYSGRSIPGTGLERRRRLGIHVVEQEFGEQRIAGPPRARDGSRSGRRSSTSSDGSR